jgi:hypothetical protein
MDKGVFFCLNGNIITPNGKRDLLSITAQGKGERFLAPGKEFRPVGVRCRWLTTSREKQLPFNSIRTRRCGMKFENLRVDQAYEIWMTYNKEEEGAR